MENKLTTEELSAIQKEAEVYASWEYHRDVAYESYIAGAIAATVKERERAKGLVNALEDIRDNYDHDADAHRYNTSCRKCTATNSLNQYKISIK